MKYFHSFCILTGYFSPDYILYKLQYVDLAFLGRHSLMADLRIPILPFDLTFFQFVLIFFFIFKKGFCDFQTFQFIFFSLQTGQHCLVLVDTGQLVDTAGHRWAGKL